MHGWVGGWCVRCIDYGLEAQRVDEIWSTPTVEGSLWAAAFGSGLPADSHLFRSTASYIIYGTGRQDTPPTQPLLLLLCTTIFLSLTHTHTHREMFCNATFSVPPNASVFAQPDSIESVMLDGVPVWKYTVSQFQGLLVQSLFVSQKQNVPVAMHYQYSGPPTNLESFVSYLVLLPLQ